MMGEIARTLVSLAGPDSVHGVIPKALMRKEQANTIEASDDQIKKDAEYAALYGRVTVVTNMHERKALMAKKVSEGGPGSGFVALSGGYGTFEELMEVTTWNSLGIHQLGVCVFNVEGYWDGLFKWIKTAIEAGFVTEAGGGIVVEAKTAEEVVAKLRDYKLIKSHFNLNWKET